MDVELISVFHFQKIKNINMNQLGSSHQFQFQQSQAHRYLKRQRSMEHEQQKIHGLTRESAIAQYLRHKKMSSNIQNSLYCGDEESTMSHHQNGLFVTVNAAEGSIERQFLKQDEPSNEIAAALEEHETEGNTRGTIQHENDFNLLQAANSYSLNEGEPAPVSTINDNTATFRGKENSHYNAYDLADADLNSVNFHHPSKESLQTKHNFVQSVESFSNQNNHMVIQKQNLVVGNAAAANNAAGQARLKQSHLNAKQKQISLQNLFDQSNNTSEAKENPHQTQKRRGSTPIEAGHHEAAQENCATIQNLQNEGHLEQHTDHHTSVFTEQADIIGPEEFDEFAPLQKQETIHDRIEQSTPVLENFSSDTPADRKVDQHEDSDGCLDERSSRVHDEEDQRNDVSQNANIITEHEEEHPQNQRIQGPITEHHIGGDGGQGLDTDEHNRRFNSHLSAFCQMQLSTREKQQAWQNLQIEGMAFSQPEDDTGKQQLRRQSEGELEQNRRASRLLYHRDRENMLINHILGDDDSKPLMSAQAANLAVDRPSHLSRPSYTQFDAMTPISMSGTVLNMNSQRPQSTTKTTKTQIDEDREKPIDVQHLHSGPEENNEQFSEQNHHNTELLGAAQPIDQFHELQASPHKIQTRDTERHTARLTSSQRLQGMARPVGALTQQQTIDTQLATTETATRPAQELDQSQHTLNQQNILKNIFFSKDSLQNPQIIKQNENIQISHNNITFKSILSSFVDERMDQAASLKKDLKDINLNLVQVTDHNLQKSKYLMQLMISDPHNQEQLASQPLEAFEQQTGQVDPQDAKVESSRESKQMNHVDLLQEQLLKLDYENNFDQAYNQVNELMINNLIDDQQANMQKSGLESKEHQHYLLLGGGECFSRSPAGSQRKSQDRTVDAEAVRELEQDVGNESNTGECKQKQEEAASKKRVNKVPSALISMGELSNKREEITVFDRLNRPKSTRSKEAKKYHTKQGSQQTCRKPASKQNDGTSALSHVKPAHIVRPATQLIQDLYYDYFARNKKKEKEQQDSQESRHKILIQKSQENLHKQNVVLAQRISGRVQKAYSKVCQSKRCDDSGIDYQSFLNILHELYYIDLSKKNEDLFELAQAIWKNISRVINRHHQSRGSELSLISKVHSSIESNDHVRKTALKDLETFILAMENVHFLRQLKGEKAPLSLDRWCLEKYNIYDPSVVKKVSAKFKPMVAHRQRRLAQIVEEKEREHFKNVNRFEPRINRKSEILVNMNPERMDLSQRGISARNANSRAHSKQSKDKTQAGELAGLSLRSQRSLSGARSILGNRTKAQSLSRSRSRLQPKITKPEIKYEDLMAGQAHEYKDQPQHHLLNTTGIFTVDLPEQCTFSPKINSSQAYKSILSNRNCASQIKHTKPGALKRARSFETNQRLSIHIPDTSSKRTNHQNVFFNLYKIAKERQEKSADSYRMAKERQAKKEVEECTFKPDFSKTQKKTKKYLERRGHGQQLEQQLEKPAELAKNEGSRPQKITSNHIIKSSSQLGHAKNRMDARSSAQSKKDSAVTTQRSKSNMQYSSQPSRRLPKKKKNRQKNEKLRQFTTQFEKENFKAQCRGTSGTEKSKNHLRSFVTEHQEEPMNRQQLLGSRLMSKKLNLSDVNRINSPENQGKVVQSVQNCRAEKMQLLGHKHIDFQKIHAKLDQSFLGQNTNWAHLGSSHQKPSSMTQSIQFNNLDEIIATDGDDGVGDLAEDTVPAQIEMILQVSPDSNRRVGPHCNSNRTNPNGDSTTNSLEVVLDVQLNELHQNGLRPKNS